MDSEMDDRLGSHAQASHSHRSANTAQTAQPPLYNGVTSDSIPHDQNGGASVTSGHDMLTTSRLAHASAHGVGQAAGPLPMLASACPGWVCYAEKTHGSYILPYISTTKSPQASDMGSHLQTLCVIHWVVTCVICTPDTNMLQFWKIWFTFVHENEAVVHHLEVCKCPHLYIFWVVWHMQKGFNHGCMLRHAYQVMRHDCSGFALYLGCVG